MRDLRKLIPPERVEPPPNDPNQGFLPLAAPGQNQCCQCGRTENFEGEPVTWVCQVCNKHVCRFCTLVKPKSVPREYYHATLCSLECKAIAEIEGLMVSGVRIDFEEDD
jgi:hypothetical protein